MALQRVGVILNPNIREAKCALRVRFEKIYLLLQFKRICPVVITIKQGDVLAAAGAQITDKIESPVTCVFAQVFG